MRLTGNSLVLTPPKAKRTSSGKALSVRILGSSAYVAYTFDPTATQTQGEATGGIENTYTTYHDYTVRRGYVNRASIHSAPDRLDSRGAVMAGGWQVGPNGL